MLVISLVEKYILSVVALVGVFFKYTLIVDSVLFNQLFPELHSN